MRVKLFHVCIKKDYHLLCMAPPPWQPVHDFTNKYIKIQPNAVFFFFVYTCRPLSNGFESLGGTRDFSGSECVCSSLCLCGFMPLKDLSRVDPEALESTRPSPIGKTSAPNAESGFQTYQWFSLIYYSSSWAPTNPAALLESCSRSSSVWSHWSAPGKEAKRLTVDMTFMSQSVTIVTHSIITWCKTVSRTHV